MKFFYYLGKTTFFLMYLAVLAYATHYNMFPLFDLYGMWTWLGMNMLITIAGAVSIFLFLLIRKPTTPQATYRRKTGVTS